MSRKGDTSIASLAVIYGDDLVISLRFGSTLTTNGPTLEGEHNDLPSHKQAHEAHRNGVHEHLVELGMNHALDAIPTLETCQHRSPALDSGEPTLAIKRTPPEIRPNELSSSVGGREGRTDLGVFSHMST